MRLDKYLKVSRLIKRRILAKEASDAERVYINNLPAKPSREVKIGDLITINYGKKALTVKVISLKESTKKIDSELMYEFVSEEMRDLKV